MNIREIARTELGDLLRLYEHLHSQDDPLPPQADIDAVWESIQSNALLRYFGAFIDGRLVASCTLSIIPNLTRGCRPYAVIENVVTHAAYRRKSLGTAVLRHALFFAWESGCYKAMLMTGRKDAGTFSFYESVGFNREEKQAFIAKPADANKPLHAISETAARER